jgi:RHS repeat-associated protein
LAGDIGTLVAVSTTNGTFYIHNNHRGDVVLTRSGTTTVGTYDYSAFGSLKSQTGSDVCRFKFSSEERDVSTGFSYYGARFYAPQWQRWPNHDPIGERGGINLYAYVGNNPVNYIDPLGLDYYVIYVTAFSGFPHQVVIGDNGSGGSYMIEYGPANGGLNRIYGPGKYNYMPYSFPPNQSPYDLSKAQCHKTSPAVDKALNDLAAGLGANNDTPNYCFLGNNCWSTATTINITAGNYQNFGTPYPSTTTHENLPPFVITR